MRLYRRKFFAKSLAREQSLLDTKVITHSPKNTDGKALVHWKKFEFGFFWLQNKFHHLQNLQTKLKEKKNVKSAEKGINDDSASPVENTLKTLMNDWCSHRKNNSVHEKDNNATSIQHWWNIDGLMETLKIINDYPAIEAMVGWPWSWEI